jgi:hypothetical protein
MTDFLKRRIFSQTGSFFFPEKIKSAGLTKTSPNFVTNSPPNFKQKNGQGSVRRQTTRQASA